MTLSNFFTRRVYFLVEDTGPEERLNAQKR